MTEQYATESISAGGLFHPSISKSATQREGERWIPYGDFPARDGSITESKPAFSIPSTVRSIQPALDYSPVALSLLPVFG